MTQKDKLKGLENISGKDEPKESKKSSIRIQFKKILQLSSCI